MTLEDIGNRRKRLLFRSWHRGTREMDLLLGSFGQAHLAVFTNSELDLYEQLLEYSDPYLYGWITGAAPVPANADNPVLQRLLAHKYSHQ